MVPPVAESVVPALMVTVPPALMVPPCRLIVPAGGLHLGRSGALFSNVQCGGYFGATFFSWNLWHSQHRARRRFRLFFNSTDTADLARVFQYRRFSRRRNADSRHRHDFIFISSHPRTLRAQTRGALCAALTERNDHCVCDAFSGRGARRMDARNGKYDLDLPRFDHARTLSTVDL